MVEIKSYDSDTGGQGAIRWRDREALFATTSTPPVFFAVTSTAITKLAGYTLPADFAPLAEFVRGDELWLGGADGTLVRGSLSNPVFTRVSTVAVPYPLRFIAGS